MIYWLTALAVWIAAGARVGRVLVRPATIVRVAIVVAVAAVAGAATVTIPEVADTLDGLVDENRVPGQLAATVAASFWVLFTGATSVVAAAAWPIASRRDLRTTAGWIYAATAAAMVVGALWHGPVDWLLVIAGALFIIVTAVRNVDWTPLGRGISIFTLGTAMVGVLAAAQTVRELGDGSALRPSPGWAWSVASLLISVGAVWILIEVWIRAKLLIRRIHKLHAAMTGRFPEVVIDELQHTTTVLKASDHVAHVMDALYLQANVRGAEPNGADAPPRAVAERAAVVARWAREPDTERHVDVRWIAPPEGVSTRRWVGELARAFES